MLTTVTSKLLEGFYLNCQIFFTTLLFALPLGLLVCFGSMSKLRLIRGLTRTFVWIIRGTPLMLQVMVVFYVPGLLFQMPMRNRIMAACIAFVINYAAYFSEIYRGGLESIPQGQYEAGQVLGMTEGHIFSRVVLMQVVKRVLAPMSNEVLTLIKDTSLANIIAVSEIIRTANNFASDGLVWPLFYSGAFYLIFCGGVTLLFRFFEKKLSYYEG